MKKVFVTIICVLFFGCMAFGLEWAGIAWKGFFALKHEAVRRDVYKQSRSFNEGKEQELLKYRLEYLRADEKDKMAIASTIRLVFADYDENLIDSAELRSFLRKIKYSN